MLPGSGCRGGQDAIPLPAGMERGFAALLRLHAQSLASHKGRVWGALRSTFLKYLGVNVSLWSRSQQRFAPCTHASCPAPSLGVGKPFTLAVGLSPEMLRSPLPQASSRGGSRRSETTIRSGGSLTGCPPSPPRAPGLCRRREGERQRGHSRRESHLRKRRQINQADSFRSDSTPGERDAFVGSEATEPAVHLPRSPRRRLWRQRQQLARPPAPAPAKDASTALNAPFDGVRRRAGTRQRALRAAGRAALPRWGLQGAGEGAGCRTPNPVWPLTADRPLSRALPVAGQMLLSPPRALSPRYYL